MKKQSETLSLDSLSKEADKMGQIASQKYEEYVAAMGALQVLRGLVEKYSKPLCEEDPPEVNE